MRKNQKRMFERYDHLLSKSPFGPVPCLIPETNAMLRNMPPPATHKKWLDLGAGQGSWTNTLRQSGYEVTAVDLDNSQFPEAIVADMHTLPFDNDSYDGCFSTGSFEHCFAPFIALLEWRRVLKNGGCILITLPSADNIKMLEDEAHYSIFSRIQFEHMFCKKLDMEIVNYEEGEWDQVVGPHQIFVIKVDKSKPNKYDVS